MTAHGGGEGRFPGPGWPLAGYSGLIYVACPGCGGRAEVIPRPGQPGFRYVTDFLSRPRRLVCPHCATAREWIPSKRDRGRLIAGPHGPSDPFFGRPLWLQTPCCGHILWAYNDQHLDTLQTYVRAGLRERTNSDPKRGMPYRLPAWIKKASHRSDVLRAIDLLHEQLNRLPGARDERATAADLTAISRVLNVIPSGRTSSPGPAVPQRAGPGSVLRVRARHRG